MEWGGGHWGALHVGHHGPGKAPLSLSGAGGLWAAWLGPCQPGLSISVSCPQLLPSQAEAGERVRLRLKCFPVQLATMPIITSEP